MTGSDGHTPRTVGRYVLWGELASGGMATVHFGRLSGPVGFSRTVAIKRLHPQYAKDPEFVTMFLDEARLVGRIRHPNVVPTLDVVTLGGEIFIVMEYVPGEALSKLLKSAWRQGMRMPPRVAATIVSSVLHGLHAAHLTKDEHGRELGIVHRDVSPQNILVGADGGTRVLDFGVAKAAGRLQTTRDGQVKGKIAYMPPEQLSGGTVSRQTDIYAAAVVLWECLASRRLFEGETEAMVLVQALEGRVEPPSRIAPNLAPEIDALVLRGLSREPAQRFATAREFALAIEQTIGLASPSEVGEWVERVAKDELDRRAAHIAEIEQASVRGATSDPRINLAAHPAEPPHSQVSSISVARPAVSSTGASRKFGGGGALFLVLGVVVLFGVFGGAYWFRDRLGLAAVAAARNAEVNRPASEKRPLDLVGPSFATTKLAAATSMVAASPPAAKPPAATPKPPPPAPPAAPKPKPGCDVPYTIDQTTGRKKYKLECLGQ